MPSPADATDGAGGDDSAGRLRAAVRTLRQWQRGDERAPHKPLLVLHALGRVARGEPRLVAFADVEAELAELLEEFGRPRSRQQPRYPFWRLQTDGIWEVEGAERLLVDAAGDPPVERCAVAAAAFPPRCGSGCATTPTSSPRSPAPCSMRISRRVTTTNCSPASA